MLKLITNFFNRYKKNKIASFLLVNLFANNSISFAVCDEGPGVCDDPDGWPSLGEILHYALTHWLLQIIGIVLSIILIGFLLYKKWKKKRKK
ncbi:MAG: hypothetical protein M9962_15680 [Oligoflexia bacterium]|nr:hypothetical protein [Oligoflexia bacterium]